MTHKLRYRIVIFLCHDDEINFCYYVDVGMQLRLLLAIEI